MITRRNGEDLSIWPGEIGHQQLPETLELPLNFISPKKQHIRRQGRSCSFLSHLIILENALVGEVHALVNTFRINKQNDRFLGQKVQN